MIKIREFLFSSVDPLIVQNELNRIAASEKNAGQKVKRGTLGSVVVELDDGEVHYVPSGRGIECIIFAK